MKELIVKAFVCLMLFIFLINAVSIAQNKKTEMQQANELSKKLANPISNLISVPFQNNFDFNYGPQHGYRYYLNFQPVIPVQLGKNFNLINRIIVPFYNQNNVAGNEMQTGLGNALYSAYFTPNTKGLLFGIGPEIGFPATNEYLGAKNWLGGPTMIALVQPPHWTFGILANNLWALDVSPDKPNVNNLYYQPFFSYRTEGAFTIGMSSENTYDWLHKRLTSGMIALNMSQIFKIGGKFPASIQLSPKYFFANKDVPKPDWGVRVVLVWIFPK